MKNVMKLSICLLVMITSITASYANNAIRKDDDKGKMVITLTLDHVKVGQQLLIKDLDGITIYKEAIATSGAYKNTFNLKSLPAGNYYFEHFKDFQVKRIPFTVSKGDVYFDDANVKSFFKPVLRAENNTLYLTQLALAKENLSVAIYYSENPGDNSQLIHNETITDTVNIERIYQLSEKKKGTYKIVLTTNDEDFVKYVNL